jgi:hypothetical protein
MSKPWEDTTEVMGEWADPQRRQMASEVTRFLSTAK